MRIEAQYVAQQQLKYCWDGKAGATNKECSVARLFQENNVYKNATFFQKFCKIRTDLMDQLSHNACTLMD